MKYFLKYLFGTQTARPAKSSKPNRVQLSVEMLEDRLVPAAAGIREEYMLEMINRMRENPAAELPRLINSNDADVNATLAFFNVDKQILAQQWGTLQSAPPLAWNDTLADVALGHSQLMVQLDQQAHDLPGEAPLQQRLQNLGYLTPPPNVAWSYNLGENIAAFSKSPFYAHASLAIDWGADGGGSVGGMQSQLGHRLNLMNPKFQELGIGLVDVPAGKQVGPLAVTEDFSFRSWQTPFLVGAAFRDPNNDGLYSMGAELGGITITVLQGGQQVAQTTTTAAGAYQLQLQPGVYTIQATGNGVAFSDQTVTVNAANIHLNFIGQDIPEPDPDAAPAPDQLTATSAMGPDTANVIQTTGARWEQVGTGQATGWLPLRPNGVTDVSVGQDAGGQDAAFVRQGNALTRLDSTTRSYVGTSTTQLNASQAEVDTVFGELGKALSNQIGQDPNSSLFTTI